MPGKTQTTTAEHFLSLPPFSLPSARYEQADDAWQGNAWGTLRLVARTGRSCKETCGSRVAVSWREGTGLCTAVVE
jgi:hypothetical protein